MSVPTDQLPETSPGKVSAQACPYLGLEEDPGSWSTYPNSRHFCHLAVPPGPINSIHQQTACLSPAHIKCKMYTKEVQGSLPPEIIGEIPPHPIRNLPPWIFALLAVAVVVLILALVIITDIVPLPAALKGKSAQSSPTQIPPTMTPRPTSTSTSTLEVNPLLPGSFTTLTPQPETQKPTSTPVPSPTLTLTPQATQGPGMQTPFGPNNVFVLYTVSSGESLAGIANLYNTTQEIIRAVNNIVEGASVWPGKVLVITPGEMDLADAIKFQVIKIDRPTKLADLAEQYGVSEQDLRLYNSLGDSEEIVPAERWLIIPIKGE